VGETVFVPVALVAAKPDTAENSVTINNNTGMVRVVMSLSLSLSE
jgi:hypothetical protein